MPPFSPTRASLSPCRGAPSGPLHWPLMVVAPGAAGTRRCWDWGGAALGPGLGVHLLNAGSASRVQGKPYVRLVLQYSCSTVLLPVLLNCAPSDAYSLIWSLNRKINQVQRWHEVRWYNPYVRLCFGIAAQLCSFWCLFVQNISQNTWKFNIMRNILAEFKWQSTGICYDYRSVKIFLFSF